MVLQAIGVIETPFREPSGTPIQPSHSEGARGRVHVYRPFQGGLQDLEGFDRIWLVYWLHMARTAKLLVTPFMDTQQRGVFATRAPARPNPIGISVVRIVNVNDGIIEIADVDINDGTPLLDIKPYVPEFDSYPESRAGWLSRSELLRRKADDRFSGGSVRPNTSRD